MDMTAEEIYEIVAGYAVEDKMEDVISEFLPGSLCEEKAEQILRARIPLAERLRTSIEDRDIMAIVDGYEAIQYCPCLKMFGYGKSSAE